MKKALSLFLVALLVFSFSVFPAYAADGDEDALLRQVTSYVVSCDKLWRLQRHYVFDAWEMENATNPQNIRPVRRTGFFVFNRDYAAYDTLACVGNLKKAFEEGDMLSEQEILELQCNQGPNMDAVAQPSRRYLRSRKKMH